MLRTVALISATLVCTTLVPSAGAQQPGSRQAAQADRAVVGIPELVRQHLGVDRYTLQTFGVPEVNEDPWSFDVALGGIAYSVTLRPNSVRSDHFEVIVVGADGVHQRVEAPAIRTVAGEVIGLPGSRVRGQLVDGGVDCVVTFPDGSTWGVQPLAQIQPGAAAGTHVVFDNAHIVEPGGLCGGGIEVPGQDDGGVAGGFSPRGGAVRICEVAFDADVEYYGLNGSSVTNTVNDIESIMNSVEGIYENNTGVTFEVTTIVVRIAESDPFTSNDAGTLLGQLVTEWSNSVYSPIRRDLVHLMTGKTMGGVLGVAYLNGVCTTNTRYGLSRSRWSTNTNRRVAVTAHEIGHNFSAGHCNQDAPCNANPVSQCQIMCSAIQGCSSTITSFSACEANTIETFADSRSCLANQPASIAAPFSDSFPSTTLDTAKWVFNQGAAVTTAGVSEPSSPNSLELDAVSSGLYQDDNIRTHFIMMAGVSNPILRYSTQARGVPNGGQLIVEVWTSQLRWVVKNTLTSDGVDDATYTEHTHTLSGVDLHNECRVRFRTLVDSSAQNWFVDDVFVGSSTGTTNGSCCIAGNCTVTTQANCGAGVWTAGGTCSPNPCSLPTGSCCIDGACSVTTQAGCAGSWTLGGSCNPNICSQPSGACCFGSTCLILTGSQCTGSNGMFEGGGSTCSPTNPCLPPTGACCLSNGDCTALTQAECDTADGEFNGVGTSCTPGLCAPVTGACCNPGTGACTTVTQSDCGTSGGVFQGGGTTCGAESCPQPTGACCVGSTCTVSTSAQCTQLGGNYAGSGSVCNVQGNAVVPCCLADFDQNGTVEVPDIFAYLSAWFSTLPGANINGGLIEVSDIFDYLTAWFNGCGE